MLRDAAEIASPAVVEAFASVPREAYLGPPPWTLLDPKGAIVTGDPADVYRDALVVIDATRGINNGQPSLWAGAFDALALRPGEHVVHAGAGTGYYTAILRALVGAGGRVTAFEVEPELAARAAANLGDEVRAESAIGAAFDPADAIVASAGLSDLPPGWLDELRDGGRLLMPLTVSMPRGTGGAMLLATRRGRAWAARFLGAVGFYPCIGGGSPASEARLRDALARGRLDTVRSLRRDGAPDGSAWLVGDGWWLSTAQPAMSA